MYDRIWNNSFARSESMWRLVVWLFCEPLEESDGTDLDLGSICEIKTLQEQVAKLPPWYWRLHTLN